MVKKKGPAPPADLPLGCDLLCFFIYNAAMFRVESDNVRVTFEWNQAAF